MFATPKLLDRRSRPERVADQAWHHLLSTVESAGESLKGSARSAQRSTGDLAGGAVDAVESVTEEARRRASLAFDALAGRKSGPNWGMLIGIGLLGAALGWAAAAAARTALRSEDTRRPEEIDFVDVDTPDRPVSSLEQ